MDHDFRKHLLQVASVALLAALTGCASAANTTISDNTRERLADALQASGDSTNAAIVRDLANKKPEPAPDPLTHVSALVAAGQVDQGMREAKAALAARGDDLGFALEVGRLAVKSGRLADAGDVYQQISRRHPDNVEALNGKGVVAAQQGDLKGAADAFRKALALRPRDVPTRNNLALAMLLSGETNVAVSMLEDLDRSDGSPRVRVTLALARERSRVKDAGQPATLAEGPSPASPVPSAALPPTSNSSKN
jgi:Flp pilus assembly protein TadD